MAPTPIRLSPVVSYGSRTRHTPLWHITFTSLLTRDVFDTHPQVTPWHNSNRPLLFIHVRLFHPQTNSLLWIFLWATSSFSRRADRYNTNPHTYKSTCLTLHSSTADDTKPLETPKTLQTTFRQADALTCRQVFFLTQLSHEILPWKLVFQIRSLSPTCLPPLVLPFHDSSSLFLSICDVFSLFFPVVWLLCNTFRMMQVGFVSLVEVPVSLNWA